MSISSNWGLSTQTEPQQHLGNFAVGAVPPSFEQQFTDSSGDALPINGYSVTTNIVSTNPDATPGSGSTSLTGDGSDGKVTYAWHADDMAYPGFYRLQMWATLGSAKYESDVFTYAVYDGPGDAP